MDRTLGRVKQRESVTGTPVPEILSLPEAARIAQPGPALDGQGADGVLPEHTFDLNFTDQRGRIWTGQFKCHVLTVRERIQVGLVRSRLSNGIPPSALDAFTSDLLEILAHLAVVIDDAPPWAKGGQLEKLHAAEVIQAIYGEVAAHEFRFHGSGSRPSGEKVDQKSNASNGVDLVPENGPVP